MRRQHAADIVAKHIEDVRKRKIESHRWQAISHPHAFEGGQCGFERAKAETVFIRGIENDALGRERFVDCRLQEWRDIRRNDDSAVTISMNQVAGRDRKPDTGQSISRTWTKPWLGPIEPEMTGKEVRITGPRKAGFPAAMSGASAEIRSTAPSAPADKRADSRRVVLPSDNRLIRLRSRTDDKFVRGSLLKFILFIALAALLSGCAGIQSALDPAGKEAAAVAGLFWVMVCGAALVWVLVMGGLYYATRIRPEAHSEKVAGRVILWAGAVFPTVVLVALLTYALWLMPTIRPWNALSAGEAPLEIEVTGEQFWWRVTYNRPGAETVHSANEVRLPAGERVIFRLTSADVIHSFWVPALGGKMDMIPGRENTLTLEATRTGIYRSPCAEFCGESHALMAFATVVMEPEEFDTWLAAKSEPSPGAHAAGIDAFLRNGCDACHAIKGTAADGTIGPNLSHVGSRETLGAGILDNEIDSYVAFIETPDSVKPGIRMPSFAGLEDAEITAIARYLKGLE